MNYDERLKEIINRRPSSWKYLIIPVFERDILILQNEVKQFLYFKRVMNEYAKKNKDFYNFLQSIEKMERSD
jgi:hypothetical protein